jgi:hypothetical protein
MLGSSKRESPEEKTSSNEIGNTQYLKLFFVKKMTKGITIKKE